MTDFIAGLVGGIAQVVSGYPFDTIKVRLQTQDVRKPMFTGAMDCLWKTVKHEGFQALYRGMTPRLLVTGLYNSVLFETANLVKEQAVKRRPDGELTTADVALAGAAGGLAVSFVLTPTDIIKSRLQVQYKTPGSAVLYKGPWDCFLKIWRSKGIPGLYQGLVISTMRDVPANAIFLSLYEELKYRYTEEGQDAPTVPYKCLAGGLAGVAFWTSIYPIDVIKSRIQTDINGSYKGWYDCYRKIVLHEGYRGLFKGFGPCIARAFPAFASLSLAYEGTLALFHRPHVHVHGHQEWTEPDASTHPHPPQPSSAAPTTTYHSQSYALEEPPSKSDVDVHSLSAAQIT
mmetsp:Transcript_15600/g.25843  ORF Transcript_15600/g.25843 Transcript_15600/m.25843 type:complete len:344 (+) Transcript_15600:180-1211(+)|eukprot:CAMPEP_0184659850 /NCGR_PEP_ID=MMETSP0308-20130426/31345_1 /TAXON_ID=38269 /ORGANISM="Gloeochaete witrockiana, Strain SAG 46.84" /LENGTH=343 /DNA_ID=CAMNT_0027099979 /DNA_START=178 /DNA_END=1209 /DNA_ORIENTATION=-